MKYAIRLAITLLFVFVASCGGSSDSGADAGQPPDPPAADELEKAQSEVRAHEELLRTLINHSVNGIIRLRWGEDDDGEKVLRSIFANLAAGPFLGVDVDDLVDRDATEIIGLATSGMDSAAADDIVRRFEIAVSRGDTLDVEVHQRSGEEDLWLRMIAEPFGDDVAVTFVDITEGKVHEELKNQELKELKDRVRELESEQ